MPTESKEEKNKNEVPLENEGKLACEVKWSKYDQRQMFTHLCTLSPNKKKEKIEITKGHDDKKIKRAGLVYVMVINDRILKIGQTIQTFRKRVGSYNSGKKKHRQKGTNSTANYFILQSILKIGENVKVYSYHPQEKTWDLPQLQEKGKEAFPSSKTVEKIFLKKFKSTYGKLPIGCTQQ